MRIVTIIARLLTGCALMVFAGANHIFQFPSERAHAVRVRAASCSRGVHFDSGYIDLLSPFLR